MKRKKQKHQKKKQPSKKRKAQKNKTTAIVAVPPTPITVPQNMSVIPKIKQTIENLERIRRFVSQCLNIDLQRAEAKARAAGKELDEDIRKSLEIDWGTIPGVDKPFLMQPGAEKMMKWLQLRPKFITRDVEHPGGHLEVISHVVLYSLVTKEEVFEGPDASCTTMETNFRFTWTEAPDPGVEKKEQLKLINMGRNRQVWKKIKGQNQKVWVWQVRVENSNIWNERNKVRQMAEKRGLVKCLRQMGAISSIFNADPSEWNVSDESDDELEIEQDYTKEGRRIVVDGKSPSGKYVDPEAQREQAKKNQQAVLDAKLKENAPHGHPLGSPQAKQAEESLRRVEEEDRRFAEAKKISGQQEAKPETKTASASKKSEVGASSLAGTTLINGNLLRVIQSKTKNNAECLDVQIGNVHYRCYHKSLFTHILQFGKMGGFRIMAYVDKRGTIAGLKQVGPVIFQPDGKTPIDTSREPGSDG